MSLPIPPSLVQTIQRTTAGLLASKYLSGEGVIRVLNILMTITTASAVALSLWDHAITFGREVDIIWSRHFDLTKLIYLMNRWGVGMGLIYAAYGEIYGIISSTCV